MRSIFPCENEFAGIEQVRKFARPIEMILWLESNRDEDSDSGCGFSLQEEDRNRTLYFARDLGMTRLLI